MKHKGKESINNFFSLKRYNVFGIAMTIGTWLLLIAYFFNLF